MLTPLTYDLRQFIHIFKSHSFCKNMLNPSVSCILANSLIRHMWIRFLERLIMLINVFQKRRWWVRHVGHPVNWLIVWKPSNSTLWKQLSLKKTEEYWFQKYTLIVQYLHMSQMWTLLSHHNRANLICSKLWVIGGAMRSSWAIWNWLTSGFWEG